MVSWHITQQTHVNRVDTKKGQVMKKQKTIKTMIFSVLMISLSLVTVYASSKVYKYVDTGSENVSEQEIIEGTTYVIKDNLNNKNLVGYYADVDDNGTVDGVIFFDYTQGADTTSGFLGDGVAVSPKTTGLASYELKTVDGHDNVVVKTSNGDDRFYVIGLQDVKPASGDYTAYWYDSAFGKISDYSTVTSTAFGTGKTNTQTMKSKWDSSAYGSQNTGDMWSINFGDWFVPSKDEWSVLGSNLKKVATGTYNSMTFDSGASLGFSGGYWSSSLLDANRAWNVNFFGYMNSGGMFIIYEWVRLATTF